MNMMDDLQILHRLETYKLKQTLNVVGEGEIVIRKIMRSMLKMRLSKDKMFKDPETDMSIHDYVLTVLSDPKVLMLMDVMTSGTQAGDIKELSAKHVMDPYVFPKSIPASARVKRYMSAFKFK
jgi:hypothetical protein